MRVVLASQNPGKVREFAKLLSAVPGLELVSFAELGVNLDVVEDRDTFYGNAHKKAVEVAATTGMPALADDSGLEVDALGGAPGVYSARYAGEDADATANNEKLLGALGSMPDAERGARFRCVLVLVDPNGAELATADGACEGHIVQAPRGERGFGYDPLFVPEGYSVTMAELPPEEKNRISHRAKAAARLVRLLQGLDEG